MYIKDRVGINSSFRPLLCLVLFTSSCVASKQGDQTNYSADEKQAIEKTLTGIIETANAGDFESVMSYFAHDAVAMPSGEMPVFGTELIRPRIQPMFDQSQLFIFLTSEETEVSGNVAFARGYVSGRMEPRSSAPTRYIDQNEYLVILRKDSGSRWKIARLMWHPMWPPPQTIVQ